MTKLFPIFIVMIAALLNASCGFRKEVQKTREMRIEDIDLSKIKDGVYQGSYSYVDAEFLVEVSVKDHRIEKIDIIEAFTGTPYAVKARAVVDTVVAHQSLNVDVITGATTTSKAYLKCIENALKEGMK
ncbi:FMN-binding protein [bacterium]|nr:FMN-binding protein [bacterium]